MGGGAWLEADTLLLRLDSTYTRIATYVEAADCTWCDPTRDVVSGTYTAKGNGRFELHPDTAIRYCYTLNHDTVVFTPTELTALWATGVFMQCLTRHDSVFLGYGAGCTPWFLDTASSGCWVSPADEYLLPGDTAFTFAPYWVAVP